MFLPKRNVKSFSFHFRTENMFEILSLHGTEKVLVWLFQLMGFLFNFIAYVESGFLSRLE